MKCKGTILDERFATFITFVGTNARMNAHMLLHVTFFGKSFAAHLTHMGSFSGVRSHVVRQDASLFKEFTAQVTFVTESRFGRIETARFDRMTFLVRFATGQIPEIFGAQGTLEAQVFVQFVVRFEGATTFESAIAQRTLVRSII